MIRKVINKGDNMKKGLILMSCLGIFLFSGCGCNSNSEKALMEEYAKDYYNSFMKDYAEGNDAVEINIEMLENANENGGKSYDLDKLKNCKSSSKVIFTLKKNSTSIAETEYDLNCE